MYGKTGKPYTLDGAEFSVDEKFIISTLMAIVVALREIAGEQFPSIDSAVENLAEKIYDQIKEVEPSNPE